MKSTIVDESLSSTTTKFFPREESTHYLVVSLDGSLWALSSLLNEKIQIGCLTETYIELITPLITGIYMGNSCEGYSRNIFIPSKSELTSTIDTMVWKDYQNMTR